MEPAVDVGTLLFVLPVHGQYVYALTSIHLHGSAETTKTKDTKI